MDKIRITSKQAWGAAGAAAALAMLSLLLAWVSNDTRSLAGWPGFFLTEIISLLIAWAGFHLLRKEEIPHWLTWLVIGAVALRLAAGVFWVVDEAVVKRQQDLEAGHRDRRVDSQDLLALRPNRVSLFQALLDVGVHRPRPVC